MDKKRLIMTVGATSALFSMSNIDIYANEVAKVDVTTLNVRSGPSTNHNIISKIHKNDKVNILEKSNGWYKVELSNKKIGWASSDYMTIVKDDSLENESTGKYKVVTTSALNVRSGPSTSNSVITKIYKGDKVEILDTKSGWDKVKLQNGKIGWSSNDYLGDSQNDSSENESTGKYKFVTTSALNVRSGPSVSNSVITKIYKGDKVEILDTKSGWDKVKLQNGKIGWSSNDYLSNSQNDSSENESTGKYKLVTTSALNVRSGPSTSYSVITKIYKGNKVEILDTKGGWDKVKLSNGKIGWSSNDYLINEENNNSNQNNTESKKREAIVDFAHKQIGKPYVWGAQGPDSFDCSGLVTYVYKHSANINLPRTSKEQSVVGKKVSKDDLKAGDLIFASTDGTGDVSHVGIYIGNGEMIHSPKPGDVVKKTNINISYWKDAYLWSRDVF